MTDAAARVGIASDGAYDLLLREGSASFRGAGDAALDYAAERLSEVAFSRTLHGVAVPYYYKGQRVGERRVFNEGLTRFLVQRLDRRAYPVRGARSPVVTRPRSSPSPTRCAKR